MKQKPSSRRRRNSTKSILRLLEHAKAAVLNSLNSAEAKLGAAVVEGLPTIRELSHGGSNRKAECGHFYG